MNGKRTSGRDAVRAMMGTMTGRLAACASAAACALALTAGGAWGQCQAFKAEPDVQYPADYFGYCAISGDTAIIGAYGDDSGGSSAGAAYVFVRDGWWWFETQQLLASDGQMYDNFGKAVAMSADVAIIGAPEDADLAEEAGSAYIFLRQRGVWIERIKLLASDGGYEQFFGDAVDIDEDIAVVGAPDYSGFDGATGSAYVFRDDGEGWYEDFKFEPFDGESDDYFGFRVAVSGPVVVVGAPWHDAMGDDNGAVYVYRCHGGTIWALDAKLLPPENHPNSNFGNSVAVDGDVILVGRPAGGTPSGAAYVYRYDGADWVEETILVPPEEGDSRFGWAVAVDDDLAVVGARYGDGAEDGTGSFHLFRFDGMNWEDELDYFAPDGEMGDGLGRSVAVSGEIIVGGAPGAGRGAAYIMDMLDDIGEDCNNNGICDVDDLEHGTSEDCNGNHRPDECDIAEGISEDCNENGVPDECDIADGTSEDCNDNGIPDECESQEDSDGDGVIDICDNCPDHYNPDQADCDDDGIGDVCAIAWGISEDCNENGIPDNCETDCNGNGIPDDCDIADGTSEDCNENAVPDECDIADLTSWDCN
ncbi:MAG: FG-GAP repeat protein, partial [Planctomycetota bacterium]|nr:FG-GAP repeat protein [Planctomycetota bacterium]